MNRLHPNWGTALTVAAVIAAFLFVQHDDHRGEWRESAELQAVQQEESAKASREFAGQAVCGPAALAQWDGDVLMCTPKRGKTYAAVRSDQCASRFGGCNGKLIGTRNIYLRVRGNGWVGLFYPLDVEHLQEDSHE